MIEIKSSSKGVYAAGLSNAEIADAFSQCLAKAKEMFGDVPIDAQVYTWDASYGDILPDGLVMIKPRMSAYKAKARLDSHAAKSAT